MNKPRIFLMIMALTWFVAGFAESFYCQPSQPYSSFAVIHMAAMAVLLYLWCQSEANARNSVLPRATPIFVALLPPIGVPVYFFRSRPWRQASVAVLGAILFGVVLVVLFGVGFETAMRIRP